MAIYYTPCQTFGKCPAMQPCIRFKVQDTGRPKYLQFTGVLEHHSSRFVSSCAKVQSGTFVARVKHSDDVGFKELPVLYDDGYAAESLKDFFDIAKDMTKPDGGPPRWFCPTACGRPLDDSPTLLYLPGIDGTGLGLILHHKSLGKFFQVRCLHIPVADRTPFEGLVNLVEDGVKLEHAKSPGRPIYLVGDSVGGCIALSVAARNPNIDLVVILVNPATSLARSQLLNLLPILKDLHLPEELHSIIPCLIGFLTGDPVKMAMVNLKSHNCLGMAMKEYYESFCFLLPRVHNLADIVPLETLIWKIRLLQTAAGDTNSRLHDVVAEVLILASCKDHIIPSKDEAKRLVSLIPGCRVRYFKDNGHSLLLETGVDLMTVIKGTGIYRRWTRRHDFISDFLPPSKSDLRHFANEIPGRLHHLISPVIFSTKKNGEIVKGLVGVPEEGPVLLVGNHMLLGVDLWAIIKQFLAEKNIVVRGLAHPGSLTTKFESLYPEFSTFDLFRIFGAVPVSASNFFRLLSTNSHVLLYPGGTRESLHLKGEQHQLHWPEEPEFVRMAAKFGAKIVPFGVVGEDDAADVVLDYKDMMKIPLLRDLIQEITPEAVTSRLGASVKAEKLECCLPFVAPKLPGRFYYLFGKPIETRGREAVLKDKEAASEVYLQVKSEIERSIRYLLKKREEDPYRSIIARTLYRAVSANPFDQAPTFDP
uniref:Uncharacterized protein n=2 Tax=Kalanchoe fedtschenkoi TaxID=63787 RepID=A0A7N0T502_KALFE